MDDKIPKWPDLVWEVTTHEERKVMWKCASGPGDSAGTTVTFDLGEAPQGRVQIAFFQAGWPHQQGNFDKCNALWGMMLHRFRCFVGKGKVAPAYT